MTVRLETRDLTLGYADREIVADLSLQIPDGQVTVVVGPNACGKSTLLRGMARLLRPRCGAVLLDGAAIHRLPTATVARSLALLPQQPVAPEGLVVAELVVRGRHPHQRLLRRWSQADQDAVTEAMAVTETLSLADRPVDELSGGQRQRVWIAMALAQQTDLLLLDEPTTFLDLSHQIEMLDLVDDLNRQRGTTVVMVLHDLNLAARYADHLVTMRDGAVVASGAPERVVTESLVHEVFGLECAVVPDPLAGTPMVVPAARRQQARATAVRTA